MANPALPLCLTKFCFSLNWKLFNSLSAPKNKVTLTRACTNRGKRLALHRVALFEISTLKNRKKTNKQKNISLQSFYHNDMKETGFLRKLFSYHLRKLNLPSYSMLQYVMFALQMFSCLSGILLTPSPPLKTLICALHYLASTSIFLWKQTGGHPDCWHHLTFRSKKNVFQRIFIQVWYNIL